MEGPSRSQGNMEYESYSGGNMEYGSNSQGYYGSQSQSNMEWSSHTNRNGASYSRATLEPHTSTESTSNGDSHYRFHDFTTDNDPAMQAGDMSPYPSEMNMISLRGVADISIWCHKCYLHINLYNINWHKQYHRALELLMYGDYDDLPEVVEDVLERRNAIHREMTLNNKVIPSMMLRKVDEAYEVIKAEMEDTYDELRRIPEEPCLDVNAIGLNCSPGCVYAVGICTDQNDRWKGHMEDTRVFQDYFGNDPDKCFFGLYDGHHGHFAAEVAANELHYALLREMEMFDPKTKCTCTLNMASSYDISKYDIIKPSASSTGLRSGADTPGTLHQESTNLVQQVIRMCEENLETLSQGKKDLENIEEDGMTSRTKTTVKKKYKDPFDEKMQAAFRKAHRFVDHLLSLGKDERSKVRWSGVSTVTCVIQGKVTLEKDKKTNKGTETGNDLEEEVTEEEGKRFGGWLDDNPVDVPVLKEGFLDDLPKEEEVIVSIRDIPVELEEDPSKESIKAEENEETKDGNEETKDGNEETKDGTEEKKIDRIGEVNVEESKEFKVDGIKEMKVEESKEFIVEGTEDNQNNNQDKAEGTDANKEESADKLGRLASQETPRETPTQKADPPIELGTLHIGNAGNVEGMLLRANRSYPITRKHTPHSYKERQRVVKAGGTVTDSERDFMLNGVMYTTRGLGNHGDPKLKKCVLVDPYSTSITIDQYAQIIVLATRGVWSVLDNDDVSYLMLQMLPQQRMPGPSRVSSSVAELMKHLDSVSRFPSNASSSIHHRSAPSIPQLSTRSHSSSSMLTATGSQHAIKVPLKSSMKKDRPNTVESMKSKGSVTIVEGDNDTVPSKEVLGSTGSVKEVKSQPSEAKSTGEHSKESDKSIKSADSKKQASKTSKESDKGLKPADEKQASKQSITSVKSKNIDSVDSMGPVINESSLKSESQLLESLTSALDLRKYLQGQEGPMDRDEEDSGNEADVETETVAPPVLAPGGGAKGVVVRTRSELHREYARRMSERLVQAALLAGGRDNISAMVILLPGSGL